MEVYETHFGWIFSFEHQPKGIGYLVEKTEPYIATRIQYKDELVKEVVEYDTLPKAIRNIVTATQSILLENVYAKLNIIKQKQNKE